MKFLGITFDSQLSFKKYFEDILDRCNTRYHRLRLLANRKWGPSQSTLIQIYKQCVRPIFEYYLSTLPPRTISAKFNCSKTSLSGSPFVYQNTFVLSLLDDFSGLPYVKDRLLSCASKSLDRIAQNLMVEETILSNRLNPAWDCFPTTLSVVRPVSLLFNAICWGDLLKGCLNHCLKQVVRPTHRHVGHSFRT